MAFRLALIAPFHCDVMYSTSLSRVFFTCATRNTPGRQSHQTFPQRAKVQQPNAFSILIGPEVFNLRFIQINFLLGCQYGNPSRKRFIYISF